MLIISVALDYLPSKNFIAIVGSAMVVMLVGWLVAHIWNTPSPGPMLSAINPTPSSSLAAYEEANADADEDGLKNWEEAL